MFRSCRQAGFRTLRGKARWRSLGVRAGFALVAAAVLAAGGCGFFREPVGPGDPARDFLARAKSQRGKAFERVESARGGSGPFDVRVVMRAGWERLRAREKEADALLLARAWVSVIQPARPERARIEFVDSAGRVRAWGLYQPEKGLFVGLGKGTRR
ncbi:MAG: hypothetical protein ACE5IM_13085 [Nitrospinota bacterium]